jgi:hypothetical protein
MKIYRFTVIVICFFSLMGNLSAQPVTSENEIKFIKGNIADKTTAVKDASDNEISDLSVQAIDFALDSVQKLGTDDRDLSALAVAGILALPQTSIATKNEQKNAEIYTRLLDLFKTFTDTTIRVAVIDKLKQFNKTVSFPGAALLLESYLQNSAQSEEKASDVQKAAINALGEIGSGSSILILYNCYIKKTWPQYTLDLENSIENLADKSLPELIKIISSGDVVQITILFNLLEESDKISNSFKAEIAENVLSEALYIADNTDSIQPDLISLEFNAVRVISKNNWTRASAIVINFFVQAKKAYYLSVITENQFIEAINTTAALSSADAAQTLSDYLGELNTRAQKGEVPSEPVILAVIKSLGTLGSKAAFDYLLYVTYQNYPDDVIAAARDALTKLKWQN